MELSSQIKATLFDLLGKEINVEEITCGVHDVGQRSELFLAACLVINPDHPSEQLFLDRLSQTLALPDDLKQQLKMQAQQAISELA